MERPDLSQTTIEVYAYITWLEKKLTQKAELKKREARPVEPSEPPTTLNVISISRDGFAKRTPRHLYSRQRRSGMGVYELETAPTSPRGQAVSDHPALLAIADESKNVLLITDLGRVFRLAVSQIAVGDVRDKGAALATHISFHPNEQLVAVLPEDRGEHVALVSERGWVQRIRRSFLGKNLFPGMTFHDVKQGGKITAACWTRGADELFIGTKLGKAIRFRETQISERNGGLGLRVDQGDVTVAITAVLQTSGVLLVSHDGKGTIRLMSGFRMNKAPGAGAKVAIKTNHLIDAITIRDRDDLFIIADSGKIIRFKANEIPKKEGVVQGVNCMTVKDGEVTAVVVSKPNSINQKVT